MARCAYCKILKLNIFQIGTFGTEVTTRPTCSRRCACAPVCFDPAGAGPPWPWAGTRKPQWRRLPAPCRCTRQVRWPGRSSGAAPREGHSSSGGCALPTAATWISLRQMPKPSMKAKISLTSLAGASKGCRSAATIALGRRVPKGTTRTGRGGEQPRPPPKQGSPRTQSLCRSP